MRQDQEPKPEAMTEELKAADTLLDQADALLHRHRGAASLMTASGEDIAADDLPLLTEVVDEPLVSGTLAAAAPEQAAMALSERLADLDGLIAREVESWLSNELPQLLSAELDRLVERVHGQALAQMRATLLPTLSRRIAGALGEE